MRDVALNGMIYFEAVARHSSVTTAAEELHVSPSSVSQQLKGCEEQLGVKLFRRVKRRLILTEEGERLYLAASEALAILRESRQQITRRRDNRKLVLRVSASFGVRWLGHRFAKFIEKNPLWDLHVDATPELTDFERENVDLDVRYGTGNWSGLYTESILNDEILPLCSPSYLSDLKTKGSKPGEMLKNARLIHTVKARLTWHWWLMHHRIRDIPTEGGLRFDRSSMALQVARDGVGVVLDSATLAIEELRTGALVPMFPQLGAARFSAYWIVCPNRHLNRRYVTVFCDWLRKEAEAHEMQKISLLNSLGCPEIYDVEPDKVHNL